MEAVFGILGIIFAVSHVWVLITLKKLHDHTLELTENFNDFIEHSITSVTKLSHVHQAVEEVRKETKKIHCVLEVLEAQGEKE